MIPRNGLNVPSLNERYGSRKHRKFVERRLPVDKGVCMLEVSQPPGDFSTPAVRELTVVEPISPGIRLTKRWGAARFNGIAPLGSV